MKFVFTLLQLSNGDVISPFKVRVSEEDLHKNYEGLVSRVCKAER